MCRCKSDNATLLEFKELLKGMEMLLLVLLAVRIFDRFDSNRDGTVDMREIIGGFRCLKYSQGDDALRICFQVYDKNRSGCISKEELASLLGVFLLPHISCLVKEIGKLDDIFDLMDANCDGKVTFVELKTTMKRDNSLEDVILSSRHQN